MKKLALPISIALLVACLALVACSSATSAGSDDSQEGTADEQTEMDGMPNPWSDVETADEMAEIAGFDVEVDENPDTYLGEPLSVTFRAMDGMAEVTYEYGASQVVVRKADPSLGEDGDVSGDYNVYSESWDETVGDVQVACYGNASDLSAKACWIRGDYDYSLVAQALGGEEDFGLEPDALAVFVEALK